MIIGFCGVGKIWLVCVFVQVVCWDGVIVFYKCVLCFFDELEIVYVDGCFLCFFCSFIKIQFLIFDDWGLDCFNVNQCCDFMEIVEDCYGVGLILIISQLLFKIWYEVIGEFIFVDVILDWFVYNVYCFEFEGQLF